MVLQSDSMTLEVDVDAPCTCLGSIALLLLLLPLGGALPTAVVDAMLATSNAKHR